jgi:hypothetical protein
LRGCAGSGSAAFQTHQSAADTIVLLAIRFAEGRAAVRRAGRYPARASVTTPVLRSTVRRRARESAVIDSSLDRTRSSIPSFSAKAHACTSDKPMNSGACERVAASASLNLLSLPGDSTPQSTHSSAAAGKRSDHSRGRPGRQTSAIAAVTHVWPGRSDGIGSSGFGAGLSPCAARGSAED